VKKISAAALSLAMAGLLALAGASMPLSAQADDGDVTWSVEPSGTQGADGRLLYDFSVDPGSVITDTMLITNYSSTPQTFQLYAADGLNDFDNGQFSLQSGGTPNADLGAWTAIEKTEVTIEAGSSQPVPFTITVPTNATPGDHSAGVVASITRKSTGESGQAIDVEQRVGARIYLRVSGTLIGGINTQGLVANYDGVLNPFAGGDLSGTYTVQNTGNTRLNLEQTAAINGPFGIRLATIASDAATNLLPGQIVSVPVVSSGILPLGLLTVDVEVRQKIQPGVGTATVTPAVDSATTWAMPWSMLGVIALLALLVLFILWRRRVQNARLRAAIALLQGQSAAPAVADPTPAATPEQARVLS
jgi:hypothetical protein